VRSVSDWLTWLPWAIIVVQAVVFWQSAPAWLLRNAAKNLAEQRRQAEFDVAALRAAEVTLEEISWTCPHHDHDFDDTCPTCNLAKQGEAALAAIEKAWNA
jgi:DNA-binding helix-hairpin-helix protein with protein kinase domain